MMTTFWYYRSEDIEVQRAGIHCVPVSLNLPTAITVLENDENGCLSTDWRPDVEASSIM